MRRRFNIAGPCLPDRHYMLPPERRLGRVLRLIEEHQLFALHGGVHTGKTTCAEWLEEHLAASGRWRAVRVDLGAMRGREDVGPAIAGVLAAIDQALACRRPWLARPERAVVEDVLRTPRWALLLHLGRLVALDPRPLALLFDEADGMHGEAMSSFLQQLRQGYIERGRVRFPECVVLIGRQPLRPPGITSPTVSLPAFSEAEVTELLQQHTAATGQRFEPEAVVRIHALGQGHPWITNALADQVVRNDVEDRSVAITAVHVEVAKETVILERRSHVAAVVDRLREPRVRRVIEPMLQGQLTGADVLEDDFGYVMDLGLVRERAGQLEIASPLYREVMSPRADGRPEWSDLEQSSTSHHS